MKFLITLATFFTVTLSFSGLTYSQPLSIVDLYERAELDIHKGWYPQDLDTLIRSSDIIVKGKFGRVLSHGPFWGYGETLQSTAQRLGEDPEDIGHLAMPLSEYEIIIDEVFLGDITGNTVTFHLLESSPGDRYFTDEADEKLFFLRLNPDEKTYGRPGIPYILTNRDGTYVYEYPSESIPGGVERDVYDFVQSTDVDDFESLLRDEIMSLKER